MYNKINLASIIYRITKFEFVDDVRDEYCILSQMPDNLFASEDIELDPEYDQQEQDLIYLGYSDAQLKQLPLDIIHKFKNIDLLIRVGRLNKNLLSIQQNKFLIDTLSIKDRQHDTITDNDINYLLDLIKNCNRIDYDLAHEKTNIFAFNSRGEFREAAVLRVLHNLQLSDWRYKTRSINYRYLGNTLFIFNPKITWRDNDGNDHDLNVYIKLDVSKTTHTAIALVSFHE